MASTPALDYAAASLTSTRLDADVYHPHDPLTASEISLASSCFRTEMLNRGLRSIKSCAVTLLERKRASSLSLIIFGPTFALIQSPLFFPLLTLVRNIQPPRPKLLRTLAYRPRRPI
jgi:hypothetical protein